MTHDQDNEPVDVDFSIVPTNNPNSEHPRDGGKGDNGNGGNGDNNNANNKNSNNFGFWWKHSRILILLTLGLVVIANLLFFTDNYMVADKEGIRLVDEDEIPQQELERLVRLNLGWLTVWIVVAYIGISIRVVDITEKGAILFLGRLVGDVDSGPHFVPRFLMELRRATARDIEIEIPGDPEDVFHGDEKEETIPEGKKLPIRVPFRDKDPDQEREQIKGKEGLVEEHAKNDPFTTRLTVEAYLVVRYRIENFSKFWKTIGDQQEAERQLQDIVVAEAIEILQAGTFARALANAARIAKAITEQTRNSLGDWGIQVIAVQLKPFRLSHELNRAIQGVAESKSNGQSKQIGADAENYRLSEEGRGRANAYKAILDVLKDNPEAGKYIVGVEALKEVIPNANTVVLTGNDPLGNLITRGGAILDSLAEGKKREES